MATLMFQIANEPHPNILELNADLPEALKSIVDKGLSKSADERYQTGEEMANALRNFKASMAG